MPREPSLGEIFDVALARQAEAMRTGMPAKVLSYDRTKQTVDVQPSLKTPHLTEDGSIKWETIPNIPGVPVVFPRGGGVAITWGISPGDHVWLAFSETAIGVWRGTGVTPSEGGDSRRHGLYPVAFAGVAPEALALGNAAPAGEIWLGDNPTDAIALASKVDQILSALKGVFGAGVAVPNDGGATLQTAWASYITTNLGPLSTTASSVVKAK